MVGTIEGATHNGSGGVVKGFNSEVLDASLDFSRHVNTYHSTNNVL